MEVKKRAGRPSENCEPNVRPPSAPLLDVEPKGSNGIGQWAASVGRHTMAQQRTLSMPQLPADPPLGIPVKPPLYGPPKPPRSVHFYRFTVPFNQLQNMTRHITAD